MSNALDASREHPASSGVKIGRWCHTIRPNSNERAHKRRIHRLKPRNGWARSAWEPVWSDPSLWPADEMLEAILAG